MALKRDTELDEVQLGTNAVTAWNNDPANPRNWSFARRATSTGIVSGIGFVRCVRCFLMRLCRLQGEDPFHLSKCTSLEAMNGDAGAEANVEQGSFRRFVPYLMVIWNKTLESKVTAVLWRRQYTLPLTMKSRPTLMCLRPLPCCRSPSTISAWHLALSFHHR